MKTNEMLEFIGNSEFVDKIYNFSYHRCSSSHEAEDLCSDILTALISALKKQERVENFYAFVWTVARRVYADFSEKRNKNSQNISIENAEFDAISPDNDIESFIEGEIEREQIRKIYAEIAFLSKLYRDIMVMYYIDEMKIKDIAACVGISETTVKQRLFSARNTVRKEVNKMSNRNLLLKPVDMAFVGTGNPGGNEPNVGCNRLFSKSLVYLCKDKPKSAKQLSEELCVPMVFVEEELDIQTQVANGKYGMLRKLENGKYITNVLVVDYEEFDEANKIYEKYLPEICAKLKENIEKSKEKILSFPFLNKNVEIGLVLWLLIHRMYWHVESDVINIMKTKYFSDIEQIKRPYSLVAISFSEEGLCPNIGYGCDGIHANSISNYKSVHITNIYGKRIKAHFHCGHNISTDPKLLLTIKAIGGLSVDALSEGEKENAAKAIECGYLRKNGSVFEPKIVVIKHENEGKFNSLVNELTHDMDHTVERIAAELAEFIKNHIPEHLENEYEMYARLIAGIRMLDALVEECIKECVLTPPENGVGAEGCLMDVE